MQHGHGASLTSDTSKRCVEGSNSFSCIDFSDVVASSDPCRKRVDDCNAIQEQTTHDMTAKTDIVVGCNFDSSLTDKPYHTDGQLAGSTSLAPQEEQPAARNPVATDGSVNHSLCSDSMPLQTSPLNGFAFSADQLTCPVIVEFFCGSARLTASLKEVGIKDAFGVDHKLDKAVAAAKRLDLTVEADQLVLLQWIQSPLVVGVFLAPPCGTCSLARNIKLRDSTGRVMNGPKPLRSSDWPEGLPGLGHKDRLRVSAANKLYDFLATVVDMAHDLGLLVVVENPRSSLFWLTRFWKQIKAPMQYAAHQACAYGGQRPKWTVLAWNHPAFAAISKCCPGESDMHKHKPWGLVQSESGTHFSTSEETAYPSGLTQAIARVFASILMAHGWKPPLEQMHEQQEVSLRSMRAIATAQPKASKMPPIVREHKKVLLITGPFADLATVPVEPMQRLKQAWDIPTSCKAEITSLPEGAQLLRTTPLRSKGGLLVLDQLSVGVFEQAWGIPFSPDEFIQEAVERGHPKLFSRLVPKILQTAIENNFCDEGLQCLALNRIQWFTKWTERAKQLQKHDADIKNALPSHAAKILEPKRLALFKEILEDLEYPDIGAFEELVTGTDLVGEVKPFGIFEKAFKPAEKTVAQLRGASKSERMLNFFKCSSSGDLEIDTIVYSKTLEEVECGWAIGPILLEELPSDAVISRRFVLKQPGKVRLIDDLSASGVNQTVQTAESPKPHSADFIAAMLLAVLKFSKDSKLMGRSFDLKSAYKQLAIAKESLSFAFVAVYNPEKGKAEVFQLLAAPFGAIRSVYSFLRLSNAIWYIGVKALNLIWSCFFDDYVVFSKDEHVINTEQTVSLLFRLLGWKFAEEGDKADGFCREFGALGIRIILNEADKGLIQFTNTEKRSMELINTINALLCKGSMTTLEAQRLRGRMQFMDGQLFGRLGKLCMREVTNHSCDQKSSKLSKRTVDALKRFTIFLEHAEPRRLHLNTDMVWHIYTDACYEPTSSDWQCGLGGVLVGPNGRPVAFFSVALNLEQMELLGSETKKTIIFEAELLALVVAFSIWRDYIRAMSLICFVDNNSARDVAISGNGRNITANCLIEFLLKLEMSSCTTPWYARIPTPSNIADEPSRGETRKFTTLKIPETSVHDGLQEIMLALAEDTVMRGSTN